MKSLTLLLCFVAFSWAVAVSQDDSDEDCSMVWITVTAGSPTPTASVSADHAVHAAKKEKAGKAAAASPSVEAVSTQVTAAERSPLSVPVGSSSSSPGSEGVTTTNNAGEVGFPINGEHLSAPVAPNAVPEGALIYTPPSKSFSGKAFGDWWTAKKNANPATKWVKITPGVYDLSVSDGIAIGFTPGGWTLDLRGVTFLVAPQIPDPTSGQAIYINQSEDMTVLGGTVWFDQGEQFSQAKVTSIVPINDMYSKVTFVIEEGYSTSVWNTAGPRNQGCVDTSNPNHFTRPDCNFWYADQYDFSGLTSSARTFTSRITSRANIKVGYNIAMIAGPNERTTLASEWNGNLLVDGMTSNGGFAQYGLADKVTATLENVWFVNPPARPGFAPRLEGPALSNGNIEGFDFNAGGQPPIIYKNCFWQYTGSMKDLQDSSNQTLPPS